MKDSKVTFREHYQAVYNQTGILPAELAAENEFPALEYLWDWFLELSRGRTSNGFGPNLLSYTEILAWAVLTQRSLERWELDCLKDIDSVYVRNVTAKD